MSTSTTARTTAGGRGDQPAPPRQQQSRASVNDGDDQGGATARARAAAGRTRPTAGAGGRPDALTPDERETLSIQWQQRLAGAAQQALQAGKLSASLARLIDHLLQPQLPWRMLLARYFSLAARDDFSYMRPSRREGRPSCRRCAPRRSRSSWPSTPADRSSTEEMSDFFSEVDALKAQVRARIALLACDERLATGAPWVFEPWEEFAARRRPSAAAGAGLPPVFDWVARQDHRPDLLVYFTDAEGEFPAAEPSYPVLWLVKGKERPLGPAHPVKLIYT